MLDYEFFYILSIPFYIIFLIILIYKKIYWKKIIINSFFYMYIIALISVTIFPIPIQWIDEIKIYWWQNNNFIPFISISDILLNNNLSIFIKVKQIIGNIIIFIPMWFFINYMYKNKIIFSKILIIGFLSSFSIELIQYLISHILWFNYKSSDIDDILLNTLGFIWWVFLHKVIMFTEKK